MPFSFMIEHIKCKMIILGKKNFLESNNDDPLFYPIVKPYLEFVIRPGLIPTDPIQHLLHRFHPVLSEIALFYIFILDPDHLVAG